MIPPIAMLIPFYLIMRDMHLLGTYLAVIMLDTVFDASFVVWMMRSYFQDVPQEMEEAALVDGASHMAVVFQSGLAVVSAGHRGLCSLLHYFFLERLFICLDADFPSDEDNAIGYFGFFQRLGNQLGAYGGDEHVCHHSGCYYFALFEPLLCAGINDGSGRANHNCGQCRHRATNKYN